MNDSTYPLIDLAAEIRAYCQVHNLYHRQLANLAGVSVSFIDKVAADAGPIYIRRISCISRLLSVLKYTLADFDPRITEDKVKQACSLIRRMRDQGCMMAAMAGYLGLAGGSGTLTVCLDAVAQGKYTTMAYDKAICLSHALEPEFEQWCALYGKRCADRNELARLGGHARSAVAPQRSEAERALGRAPGSGSPTKFDRDKEYEEEKYTPMHILRMKHKAAIKMINKSKHTKLSENPDARKAQMFQLMHNIGFDSFADFCTYTDGPAPVITWETETGLYRCEMTWDRFRSWFRKDDQEFPSTDRDIRVWHTLSNYDLAYVAE